MQVRSGVAVLFAMLVAAAAPRPALAQGVVKCLDGKAVTYSNTPCDKLGLKPAGEVRDRVTTLPMGVPQVAAKGGPAKGPAATANAAAGKPGTVPGNEIDMPKTSTLKPVNPLIEKLAK
jgi:hypothetical protein